MSRFGSVFWFVLVIATGMTNFLVKQAVQGLDDQLIHVRRQTADEQRKIHDLVREWTTLNQPELLANLNNTYIHLQPVSPKQVVSEVDDIPLRPTPPEAPQIAEAAPLPIAVAQAPALPLATPQAAGAAAARTAAPALSLISTAHAATESTAHAQPVPAPKSPSLDGLFAQIAGER